MYLENVTLSKHLNQQHNLTQRVDYCVLFLTQRVDYYVLFFQEI